MSSDVGYQKEKLFEKVLTYEGSRITADRMWSIADLLNFDTIWQSLLEMLMGLTLSADFGLGLTDFDIFHLEFDFELPSLDELLKGINIKIDYQSLEDAFRQFMEWEYGIEFPLDQILDYLNTLKYFFRMDIYGEIGFPRLPLARYDLTNYDSSIYYDPRYESWLRPSISQSSANAYLNMLPRMSYAPHVVAQLSELIGSTELANWLSFRTDFLEKCIEQAFFLGAGFLGYSKLREREYMEGMEGVHIQISDDINIFVSSLDTPCFGFILGVSLLGVDRFVASNDTVFKATSPRFAYFRAMRMIRRFVSPVSALVFRGKFGEMQTVHKSPKALKYGTHRHLIREFRRRLKNKLVRMGLNAFDINAYVIAGLDLIYRLRTGHKRAKEWRSRLSDEEFKKMWLEKWKAMGYDESILQMIYDEVSHLQRIIAKL